MFNLKQYSLRNEKMSDCILSVISNFVYGLSKFSSNIYISKRLRFLNSQWILIDYNHLAHTHKILVCDLSWFILVIS